MGAGGLVEGYQGFGVAFVVGLVAVEIGGKALLWVVAVFGDFSKVGVWVNIVVVVWLEFVLVFFEDDVSLGEVVLTFV